MSGGEREPDEEHVADIPGDETSVDHSDVDIAADREELEGTTGGLA